jgi:holo-[acyl-carrier protein] synthase
LAALIRTGVDIIEISRLERIQPGILVRFIARVFTPAEVAEAGERKNSLAGKFAAKEAVAKALGTGIGPISWREIEILHDAQRMPEVHLSGAARAAADALGLYTWSVSISHSDHYAVAVAVAIGDRP